MAVNNPYPNVSNETKYFFLRPNLHSPIVLSSYGALKFLELNFFYKYNLLSALKINRNYNLKAYINSADWKVKIINSDDKLNEAREWRDMEHDDEMLVGEFLKKSFEEILILIIL